jgi:hypothetical protein
MIPGVPGIIDPASTKTAIKAASSTKVPHKQIVNAAYVIARQAPNYLSVFPDADSEMPNFRFAG